jgi:hypothetical protein
MARFGRGIVEQLTNPALGRGMFDLGQKIGGMPTQVREKRKEEEKRQDELRRFDELSKISGQAQLSAASGTPAALAANISLLEKVRDEAPTLKEKQAIEARIIQLRNMTSSTQEKRLKGDITAVSQIDNVLEGLDERKDIPENKKAELKNTLTLRKNQLLENPDIEQGYRQDQVNAFQLNQQQEAMIESNYIRENAPKFIKAVDSGNQSIINNLMDSVPMEFKAAADKYITGAIRNNEIKRGFEERSIALRTKPMTDSEINDLVDQLPEDVRKAVSPLVEEYKDAAGGWNDKVGEWNTKDLFRAKTVEKALRAKVSSLGERVLLSDLDAEKNQNMRNQVDVLQLELQLAAPLDRMSVKDEEMRLAGQDKNKITPEISAEARENVRAVRDLALIEQIEVINEGRASEIATERSPYQKGEVILDEDGNSYRFKGGDYRDESNYEEITPKKAGASSEGDSLAEVLELFELKKEGSLPVGKIDDYMIAFLRYGNAERARKMLENNGE